MTWEEISKKYEQDRRAAKLRERVPKMGRNWENLVRSTDKLVWLYMFSNSRGASRGG